MTGLNSIAELAPRLRRRDISPVELAQECLRRIEQTNIALNAFITLTAESALAEARAAENAISRGEWRGPLHGVPIAIKDLIDTAGVRTTAASALFADRRPTEDAEVVLRLRRAGAVLIGKNNLHEFAYGGSGLISHFGEMRNPHNHKHITGGSSGGSAAAVVAGMCYAAIGTDTAGSVREPAALCGCVGLKPTYGRVSSRGVIPLASSLDHVGPLTRSVADAGIMLQAIAGYDAGDIGSQDVAVDDYLGGMQQPISTLRIGIPREHFYEDLQPEVSDAVENAVNKVRRVAKEVKDVQLEVPTDRTLQMAESYAYHAEFAKTTPDLYKPETLRRILAGEQISAAAYIHHRAALQTERRSILQIFGEVDLLMTPTTPIAAPRISDLTADPDALRPAEIKLLRNTRPFNVWRLPTISIPCGSDQNGLPIGLQIAGAPWREDLVLRFAHAVEKQLSVPT